MELSTKINGYNYALNIEGKDQKLWAQFDERNRRCLASTLEEIDQLRKFIDFNKVEQLTQKLYTDEDLAIFRRAARIECAERSIDRWERLRESANKAWDNHEKWFDSGITKVFSIVHTHKQECYDPAHDCLSHIEKEIKKLRKQESTLFDNETRVFDGVMKFKTVEIPQE